MSNFVVALSLFIVSFVGTNVESATLKNDTKGPSCAYVTNMEPALEKAFSNCKKELNISDIPDLHARLDIIDEYYRNVVKNGFNDKCFSKCLMEKLNMLSQDGTADLKVVEKLYKGGNMTNAVINDLLKEWGICNIKIEKDFPEGGDEQKICRKVAAIDNCLYIKAREMELPCPL